MPQAHTPRVSTAPAGYGGNDRRQHPRRRASDQQPYSRDERPVLPPVESSHGQQYPDFSKLMEKLDQVVGALGNVAQVRQEPTPPVIGDRGAKVRSTRAKPVRERRPRAQVQDDEVQEVRNGVTCPKYGTVAGSLWLLFAKAGAGVTLAQAKELARQNGHNPTSAAISLYNWRKFHGVPNPAEAQATPTHH